MERFLMNLDPTRGQTLRDWLRSVSVDAKSGRSSAPEMDGWPGGTIGGHLAVVIEARAGLQSLAAISAPRKSRSSACRRAFVEVMRNSLVGIPFFVPERRP